MVRPPKEDRLLKSTKHGIATLNGRQFLYKLPDGGFLFDIYHAMFLKLRGLKVSLDRNTFCFEKAEYHEATKQYQAWVYLDISRTNVSNSSVGKITVEFPADPQLHAYKPRYPNYGQVAPQPNASDVYSLEIKYVKACSTDRLYQIRCMVNEDMTLDMVETYFRGMYIQTNEYGHDEMVPPKQWKGDSKPIPAINEDLNPEILPVSARVKKRQKPSASAVAVEPEIEVRVERRSPPKKHRLELNLISEEEQDSIAVQARDYAIKHLMNDPSIKQEAIQRSIEQCGKDIMQGMMDKMNSDPEAKEVFWRQIREKAINHIFATEGDEMRASLLNMLRRQPDQ